MSFSAQVPSTSLPRQTAGWVRRNIVAIWLGALPPLIVYAVLGHRDEMRQVWVALTSANPDWLLLGLAIQILITLSPVLTYKVILERLGHNVPFHDLTAMHMQRIVVGTFTPVGGPISTFAFVRWLGHREVGPHDAVTMLALRSVATNAAFFMLLLVATALRGPIYALVVTGIAIAALLAIVKLARRTELPCWLRPFVLRRRLPRRFSSRIIEFAVRFRRHRIRWADLMRPVAISVATRFAGVVLLVVSLQAMGVDTTPKMIALVSLAEIAAKATVPFFNGIGAVEVATTLALRQSGVPADQAIGVALLWRSFEFYLPIVVALIVTGVLTAWTRIPRPATPLPELPLPRVATATATATVPVRANGHEAVNGSR